MLKFASFLFGSLVVAAFSLFDRGWPPQESELLAHFAEHREGVEALAAEMSDSDYLGVGAGRPETAVAYVDMGAYSDRVRLEGAEGEHWFRLFVEANALQVMRYDDGVVGIDVSILLDESNEALRIAEYRYESSETREFAACLDEFRGVRCGECGVAIDGDW